MEHYFNIHFNNFTNPRTLDLYHYLLAAFEQSLMNLSYGACRQRGFFKMLEKIFREFAGFRFDYLPGLFI